jgi:hypothetical protein
MLTNVPDGQKLCMGGRGLNGQPHLEGITLHHRDGSILFSIAPLPPDDRSRTRRRSWDDGSRAHIGPEHLLAYYNKYFIEEDRKETDVWALLWTVHDTWRMGGGKTLDKLEEERDKPEPLPPLEDVLPSIPGLSAAMEAERQRLLGELTKWRKYTAAVERLASPEAKKVAERRKEVLTSIPALIANVERRIERDRALIGRYKAKLAAVEAEEAEEAAVRETVVKGTV